MPKEIISEASSASPQAKRLAFWPRSTLGWIAIVLALVALASWVTFPLLTITYRETYPVVDTWVMPATATLLMDAAAISSLAAVWLRRERSVLNIVTLVVTLLAGAFATFMVVGEAIAGV